MHDLACWVCGDRLTTLERVPTLCGDCRVLEAASVEAKITALHAPRLLVDERRFDDVTLDQRDPGDENEPRFV